LDLGIDGYYYFCVENTHTKFWVKAFLIILPAFFRVLCTAKYVENKWFKLAAIHVWPTITEPPPNPGVFHSSVTFALSSFSLMTLTVMLISYHYISSDLGSYGFSSTGLGSYGF
jgi:hypothetical protein